MDITLDRRELLPVLFPDQADWLFVTGLAGSARDGAGLTSDGANMWTMAGCMGAAISTGLGMAMAAPQKQVAVIAGDGEMQMNIGSLAVVASQAPANLTIVCIDNGTHGETGGQEGHTTQRTNLAKIADGMGIGSVLTISSPDDRQSAHDFIRQAPGPRFIWARVMVGDPTAFKRNMNPMECRIRFKTAFDGAGA